ncbi:hypothetical protein PCANC_16956 [Puccinia coronata f. sp. avenae]|uniref:Uncharacterized protein n=1 Tax=Puccinia coronata f. sp. avenae TaxID=200324 RepID=A0A2N5SHR8_9BASI|nr:hypothetical protein PCANC_16956 [Puccinia coronata f. sp. avenae]
MLERSPGIFLNRITTRTNSLISEDLSTLALLTLSGASTRPSAGACKASPRVGPAEPTPNPTSCSYYIASDKKLYALPFVAALPEISSIATEILDTPAGTLAAQSHFTSISSSSKLVSQSFATHSLGDVPDQKPVKYACSRVRRSCFLQSQLQCPARIADQFKQTINQLGLQLAELKHKSPSKAQLDAFACAHINTTLAALSDWLAKCQSYDKLVQLKAAASLSGLKETQAQIVAQLSSTRPSSPSATSSNKTNCNAPHPSIPSEQSSANCSSNPPQNQPTLTSILLGPQATSSPPPSRRRQRMPWHPPLSPQPIGPISTTTQQPGRRPLAQEKRAGLAANVAA